MKYLDLFVQGTLRIPLEIMVQKAAILARTGAGKSTAAAAIVEEVLAAKQQVVIIDPKGDWWGLRASAEGGADGSAFPIPVFGGSSIAKTFDMDASAGALFADTAAEGASMILDLSEFSNAERNRFITDFAERFYRAKAQHDDPVLLVLEEADEVVPQRFGGDQARMVGAVERIVKRGRFRGIGVLLITQRSASLNKDVLTQIEVLVVMQTTSPQDRKAIDAWVENHPDEEKVAELSKGMAALKQGEAYIWSPSWLETFERVKFRRRHTYDAGRTPGIGERRREPKLLSDVDIAKLGERMKAMVEKQKENDPVLLKREITRLKAEAGRVQHTEKVVTREKHVLRDSQIAHLDAVIGHMNTLIEKFYKARDPIIIALAKVAPSAASSTPPAGPRAGTAGELVTHRKGQMDGAAVRAAAPAGNQHRPSGRGAEPTAAGTLPRRTPAPRSGEPRAPQLGRGERKILAAVAQHEGGVTRDQLTVLTGYKRSSRDTYIQRLASAGLVQGAQNNGSLTIVVTDDGIRELGSDYQPLPTGDALREHWLGRLTGGERAVLEIVVGAYPKAVDREHISEVTEYQRSSRDTYLQRLSSRKLVVSVGRGEVRASDALFG
jgi:hypothetical protein